MKAQLGDADLSAFLRDEALEEKVAAATLAGETLQSFVQTLFGPDGRLPGKQGRTALLERLTGLGLPLGARQAFANALSRASRDGRAGIAETPEDIHNRVAWLDDLATCTGDEPEWPPPARPFLVFTSAGDACQVADWLREVTMSRDWDLVVVYYGQEADPPCVAAADHSMRMVGGKFPNLLRAMRRQPAYFGRFEAILVADDDLVIRGDQINALFHVRRTHDLWLLQPANDATGGKADFSELRAEAGVALRFVNFIEVTAPLVRTDQLLAFLKEYTPRRHEDEMLVGYGIDAWMCQWLLGVHPTTGEATHRDKAAVVDAISFVNPTNDEKPMGREIDRLQAFDQRVERWQAVCRRRGLAENYPFRTFETRGTEGAGWTVREAT